MNIRAAKILFPKEDREEIINKINQTLDSGNLTLGPNGKELEDKFKSYIGTQYCIATASGTSALEIILRCIGVKDKVVLVPTNTFIATPAAVIHAGGRVKFVDCGQDCNIDPKLAEESIDDNTIAMIVVHIGGYVTENILTLQRICKERGIYLIEDAAHAHGSEFDGKKAGSFGIANAFSLYPTKLMTGSEGGLITTDIESYDVMARVLRDQGKAGFLGNVHTELGYSWRMSEVHAILALSHLKRLDEFIEHRRSLANIYNKGMKDIDHLRTISIKDEKMTNYYKYIAFLETDIERSQFKKLLKEKYSISLSGEVYELPCHLQPIFKKLYGYKEGDLPISESLCSKMICLPMYHEMTTEEAHYTITSIGTLLDDLNK